MLKLDKHVGQVNLIASVGAGGSIGPSGALPDYIDKEEAAAMQEWFLNLTAGGIVVIGGRTLRMLEERGFTGLNQAHMLVIWSGEDVDQTVEGLLEANLPIFIAGGEYTFKSFMPHVTQFFIRRAPIKGPHEVYMPELFGRAQ